MSDANEILSAAELVGCNNIFDKDPPIIGGTNLPGVAGNGNTFPQIYDALGRLLFAQLTAQF